MKPTMTALVCNASVLVLVVLCTCTEAQTAGSPSPAPAPAPDYVDLSNLLAVAGPFQTFLKYAESTKVIQTLQNQANDTEEGLTIFVPKDKAFSSLKKPSLSNLTQDQLKSFLLFHAFPYYYSPLDFKNLNQSKPLSPHLLADNTLSILWTCIGLYASLQDGRTK